MKDCAQPLQHIEHGIPPVFDERSEVLVLGTMPSPKSREAAFFYGHPQNRFWKVLADVLDDYRENALLLEQSAEGCRSPAVAELAGVQRDYSKRMEELLRDRLPRLMHGEEDPQEERAEAAALFAEYAIDFAAQGVRSALLAALAAMDQQMNCEEQQGKEHPV